MLNDLRYGLRALWHKPGFALTAILSIALGIGANASIFSFADGILLRPLPVPHASEVVTLRSTTPEQSLVGGEISWRDYLDFREQSRSFAGLAAYSMMHFGFAADTSAQPQLRAGALISANFFRVMQREPTIGRDLDVTAETPLRGPEVILADRFWNREFKGNPGVIGGHIRLNGLDFTVVGVAPEAFKSIEQFSSPDFYVPAGMGPALNTAGQGGQGMLNDRSLRAFTVKGRLKAGVSIQAASAEAKSLANALELSNPTTNRGYGAVVRTEMQSRMDGTPGRALIPGLMFGMVAVLLAIACANVANLMLNRGRCRAREIAIRIAIGASRARLLRQLMLESLLIALSGGALGLAMAGLFVRAASTLQLPGDIPIELDFQLDVRVLWFTAAVSVGSALLFGLAPALRSTKTDLVPALKSREADPGRKKMFGRSTLVIVQVAGSLVLLVMSAQLYRGLFAAMTADPGFRRDHLIMMTFNPSLIRYTPVQTEQFYRVLRDKSLSVPGVQRVALASAIPTGINPRFEALVPENYTFPPGQHAASVWTDTVDENYFATLTVPITQGRGFTPADSAISPLVAVVNEAFARHFFGGSALRKRVRLQGPPGTWIEIVGVTATGKYLGAAEPPIDAVYFSFRQRPETKMTLFAGTLGSPAALAAPLLDMVRSIDRNMPVFGVRTMMDFFEQRSVQAANLVIETVAGIGLLGLVLALVGLYAVVAYQVSGRTREIGIRMAVGANPVGVMLMILKQAGIMSVIGVAIGLILSAAASRAMSASLPGEAFNAWAFTLIPAGLLLTALLAAAIPARRAALVDPLRALRED